jgi:hypothetical protein
LLDVDGGVGSSIHGVAILNEEKKATNDTIVVAARSGLWLFNGLYAFPQLSWKIDSLWKRINQLYFDKVQVVQDTTNTRIYISVPLDAATEPSHIILVEYDNGLTPQNITFGLWQFPYKPTSIVAYIDPSTLKPILYIGSSNNNIYKLDDSVTLDDGVTIPWHYQSFYATAIGGAVGHFNGIRIRGTGVGNITINLYGEDNVTTQAPPVLPVTANPGLEPVRIFNFQNEKISVKLSGTTVSSTLTLQRLVIYGTPLWITRPA